MRERGRSANGETAETEKLIFFICLPQLSALFILTPAVHGMLPHDRRSCSDLSKFIKIMKCAIYNFVIVMR